jgi:hypothetical protein
MALQKFKHAPLPNPPSEYDPQYLRQLIRVLEMYFNQLDSRTPNVAQSYTADAFYGGEFWGDGRHIETPYAQFHSNSDQTAANTYTAYAVTYDVADYSDGISISSSSHVDVVHEGIYRFDYSISLENTVNDRVDVDIWLRKNGTDIADSNSKFSIAARKSTGDPSYLIAVTPFMISLAAGDYVQLMWRTSNTGASIQHLPAVAASAGVTPAIPATPSVILAVEFVSAAV